MFESQPPALLFDDLRLVSEDPLMAKHRWMPVAAGVALVILVAGVLTVAAMRQAPQRCHDVVAVTANTRGDDGTYDVAIVDLDGGSRRSITGRAVALDPSFSPDGRRLAVMWAEGDYESAGPDATEIWTLDRNGRNRSQLTDGPFDSQPAWSPDGKRVAFVTTIGPVQDGTIGLGVVPADGGPRRVLHDPGKKWIDSRPTWSPDGQRLAFLRFDSSYQDPRSEVWVIDDDGSHLRRAQSVLGRGPELNISWIPDTEQVLVTNGRTAETLDVSTGAKAAVSGVSSGVGWSGDGKRAYFFDETRLVRGHLAGGIMVHDKTIGDYRDAARPPAVACA